MTYINQSIMAFIGQIEYFNLDDDFECYVDRMDHLLKLNKITENSNKVSFLISTGGADLYKILKTLVAPKKPENFQYDELVVKLRLHFQRKTNVTAERFKFLTRNQLAEETMQDYIITIKSLATTCNYGTFLEEVLKDRLLMGIRNKRIQAKLIELSESTFESTCEVALNMEMLEEEVRNMGNDREPTLVNKIGSRRSNEEVRDVATANTNRKKIQCFYCGRWGHIQKFCNLYKKNRFSGKNQCNNTYSDRQRTLKNNCIDDVSPAENEEQYDDSYVLNMNSELGYLNSVSGHSVPVHITLNCSNVLLRMEVDSGACTSIIHMDTYRELFSDSQLKYTEKLLRVISGQHVNVVGYIDVLVRVLNSSLTESIPLSLYVITSDRTFTPLLGRSWMDKLFVGWRDFWSEKINSVTDRDNSQNCVVEIFKKFDSVLNNVNGGPITKYKADIVVKESASPIFFKPYTAPFGLRGKIDEELDRLQRRNIIYPVRYSRWASPIVVVEKANGGIRICVDCKVTINRFITTDHYPLPRCDDIFANLTGCVFYCVLDLEGAYQQVEVSEESQEYLTINTHRGLFRYKRLIFGVKSAPAIFQSIMDNMLNGLSKTQCYLDDIIIGGSTFTECKQNLWNVLSRLGQYNVRVNASKCQFFKKEITFLGHRISDGCITPCVDKLDAIYKAPRPDNLTQLRSYLGLLNYYTHFIPNLSSELCPLYELTRKGSTFKWSENCENCFIRSKDLLHKHQVLILYDPQKPIVIQCDASPYGVGAILSHEVEGILRPVLFASSTLSQAEQNYSQLHREALAIIFAVKKFHKYIYGKHFVIQSDHQPLREIFNPTRPTSMLTVGRLVRWSVLLSMYDYTIQYKKASIMANADGLSRLPTRESTGINEEGIHFVDKFQVNDVSIDQVKLETEKDNILREVVNMLLHGWLFPIPIYIRQFYNKRISLSWDNGCLWYNHRLVVPTTMRSLVLKSIHESHIGVVKMKLLAKTHVWWPGIDSDIEEYVLSCNVCQSALSKPISSAMMSWPESKYFFERIHLDFFHFRDKNFLIIVDTYSKWLDVKEMVNIKLENLVNKLREIFAYFGIPKTIISDNGPPFSSEGFIKFCSVNSINCMKSPPYHPESNGTAERAVQTVKTHLKKYFLDPQSSSLPLSVMLSNLLLKYRLTPSTVTGRSPNDCIFIHKRNVLFSMDTRRELREEYTSRRIDIEKPKSVPHLRQGENIFYRIVSNSGIKWVTGTVIKPVGNVMYLINVNGYHRTAHISQLRKDKSKSLKFIPPLCKFGETENVKKRRRSESDDTEFVCRRSERLKQKKIDVNNS